jgi:hypothetical protein
MTGIEAEYGTTADGLLAVRIDYLGLVAVPDGDGYRVESVLSASSRPIATWSEKDRFGRDGMVADESGFRAHADATLHHFRQRAALGRERLDGSVGTPWGPSQSATRYAEGVVCYDTASHGGFYLDEERNGALHAALRYDDGWYEEDCDWARVAVGYPDLFTDREQEMAERTLRDWAPEAWEDYYGRPLDRAGSHMRDREAFEREHADDWIVIAASLSREQPDHVVATASLGGRRGAVMTKDFLVPDREYARGRHGFVIDLERHKRIE